MEHEFTTDELGNMFSIWFAKTFGKVKSVVQWNGQISFILSNTIMVAQYGAQNGSCILKNSHFASEGCKNC